MVDAVGSFDGNPFEILSIDDSSEDQQMLSRMVRDNLAKYHLSFVSDGPEAMKFLKRERPYCDAPRPNLIILDLHLPKMDGHEILKKIRECGTLREIPVLMHSSSNSDADVRKCKSLDGNGYIVKPTNLEDFDLLLTAISELCGPLGKYQWIELSAKSLKRMLEIERKDRQQEEDGLMTRIRELESQLRKK